MVSDDDLFFNSAVIKEIINILSGDELLGVVSVAPEYNSAANIFYKLKRKIHSIEEKVCAPATIYGDLLAFKRDIISYLHEDSLAEDLQLCLRAITEGFRVKIIVKKVHENYPKTMRGILSRTRRTITGTFIEYQKSIKDIFSKRGLVCAYIYSSYMVSLLLLSPLLLLFLSTFGILIYNIVILIPQFLFSQKKLI
ncbi:glycosyltransferase family 2 protein [Aeropyrum camini]|uniref:glycosyltransferase family 2 protein n=1 Tax=Aeropyrum camini TaxID=229980 RepID=UPI0009EC2767